MIKLECIEKVYDKNGRIVMYILVDDKNRVQTVDKKSIKKIIKKYNVTNLQIASDGRVVNKAVSLDKKQDNTNNTTNNTNNTNKQDVLIKVYEDGYKKLRRNEIIVFGSANVGEKRVSFFYENTDKLIGTFVEDNGLAIPVRVSSFEAGYSLAPEAQCFETNNLIQGFEKYLREKYGCTPLKLVGTINNVQYTAYGLHFVWINCLDMYNRDNNNERRRNYITEAKWGIQGQRLDGIQPICLRGVSSEKGRNIARVYVDKTSLPSDGVYLIKITYSTEDGTYKDILEKAFLLDNIKACRDIKIIDTPQTTQASQTTRITRDTKRGIFDLFSR